MPPVPSPAAVQVTVPPATAAGAQVLALVLGNHNVLAKAVSTTDVFNVFLVLEALRVLSETAT